MKSYVFGDIIDKCKLLGRHWVSGEGVTFDFSAATLEFRLFCKGDVSLSMKLSSEVFFTLSVDGKEQRVSVPRGEQTLTLAAGLDGGEHLFSLIRQTSAASARAHLISLAFEGEFLPPPPQRKRFIEFIGDSITCGYGTHGRFGDPHNDEKDDATRSFAYRTAKALGADYEMMSVSGMGIAYGYTPFTVNEVYPCHLYFRDKEKPYTFTRKPDLVVINLGTNDYSKWPQGKADASEHLTDEVRRLVDTIYGNYGFAYCPIVLCHGAMNTNGAADILSVIPSYTSRGADIRAVRLSQNLEGVDCHPSDEGAMKQGEELTLFLRENFGEMWES